MISFPNILHKKIELQFQNIFKSWSLFLTLWKLKDVWKKENSLVQGYNWTAMVLSHVENYLGNGASNLFHVLSNTEVSFWKSEQERRRHQKIKPQIKTSKTQNSEWFCYIYLCPRKNCTNREDGVPHESLWHYFVYARYIVINFPIHIQY